MVLSHEAMYNGNLCWVLMSSFWGFMTRKSSRSVSDIAIYLQYIDRTVIGLVCSFERASVIRVCNVYIQYIDSTVIGLVCGFDRASVIMVCNGNNVADEFAIFLVMCQCFFLWYTCITFSTIKLVLGRKAFLGEATSHN